MCPGYVFRLYVQVRCSGCVSELCVQVTCLGCQMLSLPCADPDEGHPDEQEGEIEELCLDVPLLEDYHSADE